MVGKDGVWQLEGMFKELYYWATNDYVFVPADSPAPTFIKVGEGDYLVTIPARCENPTHQGRLVPLDEPEPYDMNKEGRGTSGFEWL